jgi:hypothetical protein
MGTTFDAVKMIKKSRAGNLLVIRNPCLQVNRRKYTERMDPFKYCSRFLHKIRKDGGRPNVFSPHATPADSSDSERAMGKKQSTVLKNMGFCLSNYQHQPSIQVIHPLVNGS